MKCGVSLRLLAPLQSLTMRTLRRVGEREPTMITGVHCIVYNKQAEKLRAFFRDVLAFPFVDAGHDWLIFALPPAELGIHPTRDESSHEMYVMCDDLEATLAELKTKGVEQAGPISDQAWGRLATIKIPGDDVLRIYEPRHETAIGGAIGKPGALAQGLR